MAAFTLEKKFGFEAAHCLHGHDGKCARMHGHSYVISLEVGSDDLIPCEPKMNMVMDFTEMSSAVSGMVEKYLDHHCLNETLETDWPTSEFIAVWVYCFLKKDLPRLQAVVVQETAKTRAVYRPTPGVSHKIERGRVVRALVSNGKG